MEKKYTHLRYACYTANISMSIVGNLSPILFLTFRSLYGISYSLLGLLILINYITQLGIDLVFSFFSHRFDISKVVKRTPLLTILGLLVFAASPLLFPNAVYVGLAIGTAIFSAAAGLCEVLISPVIATIPAKDPDREMSRLHSVYAWGVVFVVIFSTVFLQVFGVQNWQYLVLCFLAVPLASAVLFARAEIPQMETPERAAGALGFFRHKWLWLCCLAIFLGGSAECTMAQWSSGYLEQALGIPKVWGDIFGVALFAVMLGLGRTLYARYGKNIGKVLFLGSIGASACYLTAAITNSALLGLAACAFTGFCTSMLWPGNLVVASEKFPNGGVFIYAIMAAGGDLGASVGPQLVGIITDAAIADPVFSALARSFDLTVEQLGMKLGLLSGMLFPLTAIPLYCAIMRAGRKESAHK